MDPGRLCWMPVGQTQERLDVVSERKRFMAISHIKFIWCNCYMTVNMVTEIRSSVTQF